MGNMGMEKALKVIDKGLILRVEVMPNAARDSWAGYDQWREAVKVRIAARPRDGEANVALARFVATTFGISSDRVTLHRGGKSRLKEVLIQGLDERTAIARLEEALVQ